MKPLLTINRLSMHFFGLKAVDDLSFTINQGEVVGLIGPNGAGKTTVFNCITKFYQPTSGEMILHQEDGQTIRLNDVAVHDVVSHGIVRTFQNIQLVGDLSVLDNVLIGAHKQFKTSILGQLLRRPKAIKEEQDLRAKAIEILTTLGLQHVIYQYVQGQPYGVLKKIEIARALMSQPRLLILDEPAAGLNEQESESLVSSLSQLRELYGCALLIIEHDMSFVMKLCERICAISFGKLLAIDTPKNIQTNALVIEAYLGGDDD